MANQTPGFTPDGTDVRMHVPSLYNTPVFPDADYSTYNQQTNILVRPFKAAFAFGHNAKRSFEQDTIVGSGALAGVRKGIDTLDAINDRYDESFNPYDLLTEAYLAEHPYLANDFESGKAIDFEHDPEAWDRYVGHQRDDWHRRQSLDEQSIGGRLVAAAPGQVVDALTGGALLRALGLGGKATQAAQWVRQGSLPTRIAKAGAAGGLANFAQEQALEAINPDRDVNHWEESAWAFGMGAAFGAGIPTIFEGLPRASSAINSRFGVTDKAKSYASPVFKVGEQTYRNVESHVSAGRVSKAQQQVRDVFASPYFREGLEMIQDEAVYLSNILDNPDLANGKPVFAMRHSKTSPIIRQIQKDHPQIEFVPHPNQPLATHLDGLQQLERHVDRFLTAQPNSKVAKTLAELMAVNIPGVKSPSIGLPGAKARKAPMAGQRLVFETLMDTAGTPLETVRQPLTNTRRVPAEQRLWGYQAMKESALVEVDKELRKIAKSKKPIVYTMHDGQTVSIAGRRDTRKLMNAIQDHRRQTNRAERGGQPASKAPAAIKKLANLLTDQYFNQIKKDAMDVDLIKDDGRNIRTYLEQRWNARTIAQNPAAFTEMLVDQARKNRERDFFTGEQLTPENRMVDQSVLGRDQFEIKDVDRNNGVGLANDEREAIRGLVDPYGFTKEEMDKHLKEIIDDVANALDEAGLMMESGVLGAEVGDQLLIDPDAYNLLTKEQKLRVRQHFQVSGDGEGVRDALGHKLYDQALEQAKEGKPAYRARMLNMLLKDRDHYDEHTRMLAWMRDTQDDLPLYLKRKPRLSVDPKRIPDGSKWRIFGKEFEMIEGTLFNKDVEFQADMLDRIPVDKGSYQHPTGVRMTEDMLTATMEKEIVDKLGDDVYKRYLEEVDLYTQAAAEKTRDVLLGIDNAHGVLEATNIPSHFRERVLNVEQTDPSVSRFLYNDFADSLDGYHMQVAGRLSTRMAIKNSPEAIKYIEDMLGEKASDLGYNPDMLMAASKREVAILREAAERSGDQKFMDMIDSHAKVMDDVNINKLQDIEHRHEVPGGKSWEVALRLGLRSLLRIAPTSQLGNIVATSVTDLASWQMVKRLSNEQKTSLIQTIRRVSKYDNERLKMLYVATADALKSTRMNTAFNLDMVDDVNMPPWMRKADRATSALSSTFFRHTGMNLWNRFMKTTAAHVVMDDIIRNARLMAKAQKLYDASDMDQAAAIKQVGLREDVAAEMNRLGMNGERSQRLLDMIEEHGTGWEDAKILDAYKEQYVHPQMEKWFDQDRDLAEAFRGAIDSYVMDTIVEPKMASRPLSANGALGRLFHQYSTFGYAWGNQQVQHLANSPAGLQAAYMLYAFGFSALADALHNQLTGRRSMADSAKLWGTRPWTAGYGAFARSPLLGWVARPNGLLDQTPYGMGAMTGNTALSGTFSRQLEPSSILLGPSFGWLDSSVGTLVRSANRGEISEADQRALFRSMPYRNIPWLEVPLRTAEAAGVPTPQFTQPHKADE